jgi:hypothetical protein
MRPRLIVGAIMIASALCATGCTAMVTGAPVPSAHYTRYDPADANAAFGDLSSIDPCSLADVATLPGDLDATPGKPQSLDYCELKLDVAGDSAYADFGELISSPGEHLTDSEQVAGGITMFRETLSYGSCDTYLAFTGNPMYLLTEVSAESGEGSDALCTASQAIARNVATSIAQQRVAHVTGVPSTSLRRVDACGLVDTSVLGPAGLGSPVSYPARHQCVWNAAADDLSEYAQLLFLIGPRPAPTDDATAVQIAGRASVEQATDADDFGECQIDTGGVASGPPQQDLVEIAEVFVYASDQTGDATCQLATTIAAAAWPKLPASA